MDWSRNYVTMSTPDAQAGVQALEMVRRIAMCHFICGSVSSDFDVKLGGYQIFRRTFLYFRVLEEFLITRPDVDMFSSAKQGMACVDFIAIPAHGTTVVSVPKQEILP